ncbi:MAG TPA: HTTM domain-containing protein [Polyangiaceae bacterium]|nr:HTTM domain-containing protein [Polyangiaceae bacterium]
MSAPNDSPPSPRGKPGFFAEERDAYVLGLLRIALSVLLFLNGARLILELERGGYFGDFFHLPIWPEALVPSRALYLTLLLVQALAAVLGFLGLWPRGALLLASSIGLFLLGCDRLQYHNNRYALLLLGFLLAFTPCDRSFLLSRPKARALPPKGRIAPTFARRLFQIQVSLVYLSSACGKLLDPEWRGGAVLHMRFASVAPFWAERGIVLPPSLEQLLSSALFASLASKIAISTELFIALGLWLPSTRRVALWVGVLFHFWIEVSARVELFSWVMGASYLAFVLPELRERRFEYAAESPRGRALARAVRLLDWCARFEIAALPAGAGAGAFRVIAREGQAKSGLTGFALLAEALPLLFPFWAPLALLGKWQRAPKASVSSA